jgi:hypothetical protein
MKSDDDDADMMAELCDIIGDAGSEAPGDGSLARVSAPPPSTGGLPSESVPDDTAVSAAEADEVQATGESVQDDTAVSAADADEVQATSESVPDDTAVSAADADEVQATSDSGDDSSESSSSEGSSSEGEEAETWDEVAARATAEAAQRVDMLGGDVLAIVPWQAHWRSSARGRCAASESPV